MRYAFAMPIAFLVLILFPEVSKSQIVHGQFIDFLQVLEDGDGRRGNSNLVNVGACWYRRGNALHEDWRSWVDAYPTQPPGFPIYFKYEKFPQVLNHEFESGTSIAHPVESIEKNRVGVANFFFEPVSSGGADPFFAAPTDTFDMSFSSEKSSVKFIDNITENNSPPVPDAGYTAFHLRIRIDGANNVTRANTISAFIEHRVATYVQNDEGDWINVGSFESVTNEVVVGVLTVNVSNAFLDGDRFHLKLSLNQARWFPLPPETLDSRGGVGLRGKNSNPLTISNKPLISRREYRGVKK